MKFHVLSDIHLEFYDSYPGLDVFISNPEDAEYLCLCGDIGDPMKKVYTKFLEDCCMQYKRVFVLAGNHEMYGTRPEKAERIITDICERIGNDKIVFLSNSGYTFDEEKVRVIGSTLWSEIAEYERSDVYASVADFRCIKDWSVERCNNVNKKSIKYIAEEVQNARASGYRLVIMTHHAPSWSCGHPRHRGSCISTAFKNRLDDYIKNNTDVISAWFYGHDHYSMDFKIGNTRILSNQPGYLGEKNNMITRPATTVVI